MHPRLRLALSVLVAATAAVVAVVAIASGSSSSNSSEATFQGGTRPADAPRISYSLRDQDGKLATQADLEGKPVVVAFLYSTCESECPLIAQQIRGALDELGKDSPPVVAFTVDPKNDTPGTAREFLLKQRVSGRVQFLLGTQKQLEPVWQQFGIAPQQKGKEHSAYVVLLDASGKQRVGFPLDKLSPEALAADLRKLSAEQQQ